MEHLEQLQRFYKRDVFASELGIHIDEATPGDGGAVCSLDILDRHRNAMGNVQGGLILTLADFAFAVAANQEICDTVTLSSSASFLGTTKGSRLIARAVCIKQTRVIRHYQIEVFDELDNPVASVGVTGYKTGRGPCIAEQ